PFRRDARLALARELRFAGFPAEAVAQLRSAEQSGLELDDDQKIELGSGLAETGKIEEARGCFKAAGAARPLEAEFGLTEVGLRTADTAEEWKGVLGKLSALQLPSNGADHDHAVGLFLEKCLKFATECDDRDLVAELVKAADAKVGAARRTHPAYG